MSERLEEQLRPFKEKLILFEKMWNKVEIMEIEQGHFKELFETRLKAIERAQETQGLKLDQLITSLATISAEIDKSPMGRSLLQHVSEANNKYTQQEKLIEGMIVWQNRVDGVLLILKWLGASGLAALAISLIRLVLGK